MTHTKIDTKNSLIPYLSPSWGGFHLECARISDDEYTPRTRFPFVIISDSGSFTRILEARIASHGGSTAKRVFLLLSRDAYPPQAGKSTAITNRHVEESWQRACENRDGSTIVLQKKAEGEDRYSPFRSVFYCQARDIFFHPPCPACGNELELCTDDEMLIAAGLQAYGSSLRRYLYCPECAAQNRSHEFYAPTPSSTDPDTVKDLNELIRGFQNLTPDILTAGHFPCIGCEHHAQCYGQGDLASKRIVPFSFYPFHLLVCEPSTITADDFTSLLSGASPQDLESQLLAQGEHGRSRSVAELARDFSVGEPLFFPGDDRRFLEILCLKSTLLAQIARMVLIERQHLFEPDLAVSLDRIWVSLNNRGSLLPFFWNFSLTLFEPGELGQLISPLPAVPPAYSSYVLGCLWFQMLVRNSQLSAFDIHTSLAERIDGFIDGGRESFQEAPESGPGGVFQPENIFWVPREVDLPGQWTGFWNDVLDLGWSLLKHGVRPGPSFSHDDFLHRLEDLRNRMKEALFSQADRGAEVMAKEDGEVICEILDEIISSWSAQMHEPPQVDEDRTVIQHPPEQKREAQADEDVQETVILSTSDALHTAQRQEEESPETVVIEPRHQAEDEIPEAVILDSEASPKETAQAEKADQQASPREWDEDIPETVIIPQSDKPQREPPQGEPEEDIPETVILNPHEERAPRGGPEPHEQGGKSEKPEDDDFLEETVILKPDKDS
ncbi:MAG: hypothetical protein ACP5G0_12880 [Desulfomonilia bacterium]